MLTAEQVADYFLRLVDEDAGDSISNLKLQKLVYYAQAWHLAITGEPLFADCIEAWAHGPVVPSLYSKYKIFGWEPIRPLVALQVNRLPVAVSWEGVPLPRPDTPIPDIDPQTQGILDDVWAAYGQFTAKRLEELTHSEDPWIEAREGCRPGDPSNAIISHDAMRAYYASKLAEDQQG